MRLIEGPVRRGFLFPPLNPSGEVLPAPFGSAAAQSRLSLSASQFPDLDNRNVTLHGLRSGCATSLALAGRKPDQIMDHVGWRSSSTALHYIKLNQVLSSGGATDALSSLTLDLADAYKEYNDLRGFIKAFT